MVSLFPQERRYGGATGYLRKWKKGVLQYKLKRGSLKSEIRIAPGDRKWIDRKIKDERIIFRKISMSSGTATILFFNMIVIRIESFIIQKRIIRTGSGTATTNLFQIKAESFQLRRDRKLSKVFISSSKKRLRECEEGLGHNILERWTD
ncbi:hypothetical protein Tco_0680574 [Tanacetum coccineum]|uniref:Uncharacterized protein n=1 Tax=Tanacetum coccineum TaxID=301880 RepID=A0ABQ4XMB7_9ASTR